MPPAPSRLGLTWRLRRLPALAVLTVAFGVPLAGTLPGPASTLRPLGAAHAAHPPANAGERPLVRVGGWIAARQGSGLPAATRVSIDVELRSRDAAALAALIAAQRNPASPEFHRWLTPASFAARFGPDDAEAAAVERWAASFGIAAGRNGAELILTAPAPTLGRALGTTIVQQGGRLASTREPSLPARVDSDLAALWSTDEPPGVPLVASSEPIAPFVGRIATVATSASMPAAAPSAEPGAGAAAEPGAGAAVGQALRLRPASAAAVQSCAAASSQGASFSSVGDHYGIGTLQATGDDGQGETIGLFELAGFSMGDIDTYESCLGVDTPVTAVQIGIGRNPVGFLAYGGEGSEEAELDIEAAIAEAPDAHIVVYEGSSQYSVWQAMIDGATVDGNDVEIAPDGFVPDDALDLGTVLRPPAVISVSWGWPWSNPDSAPEVQPGDDPLFEQAASQGQSIFAASGDFGSSGGTLYPADSPWVTGVGGTIPASLASSAGPDTAWPLSTGGFSPVETEPAWQEGVEGESPMRGVPDVAADASSYSVYAAAPPFNDVADVTSGGTVEISDTAGDTTCETSVPASPQQGPAECDFVDPPAGDTVTAAYTPTVASGLGGSTTIVDGTVPGVSPTTVQLIWAAGSATLYAQVLRAVVSGDGDAEEAPSGGTVSFTDGAGAVPPACASLAVPPGGLVACPGVALGSVTTTDTITASYVGDAGDGSSSTSSTLGPQAFAGTLTSPQIEIALSGALHEWYVEPQLLEAASRDWPWMGVGGTSAAAPLWAGLTADADDTCTASIGEVAPALDSLYATDGSAAYGSLLTDVTSGGNGDHDATVGWDPVTGLGTPIATGLTCPQLATISAPSGAAGQSLTLTGSNLAFATVQFGGTAATVTNRSASSLTVVVPPGSGQVEVTAGTLLGSGTGIPFGYPAPATSGDGSPPPEPPPAPVVSTTTSATTTAAAVPTTAVTTTIPRGDLPPPVDNPASVSTAVGRVTITFQDHAAPGRAARIVLLAGRRMLRSEHVRLGPAGTYRWVSPVLRAGTFVVELRVRQRTVHRTVIHVRSS